MTLNPKALEAAQTAYRNGEDDPNRFWGRNRGRMTAAITAYLAALPPPAEAGELVERLRTRLRWVNGESERDPDCQQAANLILSLTSRLETVTRERDALNSRKLRYAPANGQTFREMQEAVHKTGLYLMGDARLVWVNEGDFWMLFPVDSSALKEPS